MSKIKSSGSRLELKVRRFLWANGFRYRISSKLPGKPDLSIKRIKTVIFIDSCFWHGCDHHCRIPKSNSQYWHKKINSNRQRDTKISKLYLDGGWTIIRLWEHELSSDFFKTMEKVKEKLYHLSLGRD